jgi:hypothetical protein
MAYGRGIPSDFRVNQNFFGLFFRMAFYFSFPWLPDVR